MRNKPTTAEFDLLVGITMRSLPDSLTQRKAALVTLLYLLPRSYEGRAVVSESLAGLRAHDQAQARFQFTPGGKQP